MCFIITQEFFFLIFIGVQLIYNVVLVSAVQQSESVIHISTLFQILFSRRSLQSIEQSSLCYRVGPSYTFQNQLVKFYKSPFGILDGITLTLQVIFGRINIFIMLTPPIFDYSLFPHLFRQSLESNCIILSIKDLHTFC